MDVAARVLPTLKIQVGAIEAKQMRSAVQQVLLGERTFSRAANSSAMTCTRAHSNFMQYHMHHMQALLSAATHAYLGSQALVVPGN